MSESKDNFEYLRAWANDIRKHNGKSVDADRLEAIAAEIDRLRALTKCDGCGKEFDENGGICEPCYSISLVAHLKPKAAEIDSLRVELAAKTEALDRILAEHAKAGPELNRLNAENEELWEVLPVILEQPPLNASAQWVINRINAREKAGVILAKHKERLSSWSDGLVSACKSR